MLNKITFGPRVEDMYKTQMRFVCKLSPRQMDNIYCMGTVGEVVAHALCRVDQVYTKFHSATCIEHNLLKIQDRIRIHRCSKKSQPAPESAKYP